MGNPTGDAGPTALARTWDDVGRQGFVPAHYEFSNEGALYDYIAAHPVGQVFAAHEDDLHVTTAPFIHARQSIGGGRGLSGHISGRNRLADVIRAGAKAVLRFESPGAYISPRWFRVNNTAATYSYVSVTVRGRFVPILDEGETALLLARTTDHMEAITPLTPGEVPWSMESLSEEQMTRYQAMVQAFHFEVESIEGIARLNQEKARADMEGIISGLWAQDSAGSRHIARLMQANLERTQD